MFILFKNEKLKLSSNAFELGVNYFYLLPQGRGLCGGPLLFSCTSVGGVSLKLCPCAGKNNLTQTDTAVEANQISVPPWMWNQGDISRQNIYARFCKYFQKIHVKLNKSHSLVTMACFLLVQLGWVTICFYWNTQTYQQRWAFRPTARPRPWWFCRKCWRKRPHLHNTAASPCHQS